MLKTTVGVLLVLLLYTGVAYAMPEGDEHEMDMMKMMQMLGMTEDQMMMMGKGMFKWKKDMFDAKYQYKMREMELHELLMESTPNEMALDKKMKEVGEAKGKLTYLKYKMKWEMFKMLTPEQKKMMMMHMMKEHHKREGMRDMKDMDHMGDMGHKCKCDMK